MTWKTKSRLHEQSDTQYYTEYREQILSISLDLLLFFFYQMSAEHFEIIVILEGTIMSNGKLTQVSLFSLAVFSILI